VPVAPTAAKGDEQVALRDLARIVDDPVRRRPVAAKEVPADDSRDLADWVHAYQFGAVCDLSSASGSDGGASVSSAVASHSS